MIIGYILGFLTILFLCFISCTGLLYIADMVELSKACFDYATLSFALMLVVAFICAMENM